MPQEAVNIPHMEYFFHGIDFSDKLILDAGTGAGGTTENLVDKVIAAGKSSRVISIDHRQEALDQARNELGNKAEFVRFLKADLTDMPQVESSSVDIIACTDVLCMIEMRPLRSLRVISEFSRVLKPGGNLIIGEQIPVPKAKNPKEEVWARRWQIAKAMNHIQNQSHLEEIQPEDLEYSLNILGFNCTRWAIFDGKDFGDDVEWGLKRPLATAMSLDEGDLRDAFVKEIGKLRDIFTQHGGAFLPYYIIHARKSFRTSLTFISPLPPI